MVFKLKIPVFLCTCTIALALAGLQVRAAVEDEAPRTDAAAVVSGLHQKLVEVMHEPGPQNFEKRYEALAPVVTQVFDTPAIAKVILSRYWDTLSEDQRREFENLLERFSIATYASRFDGYSGEQFVETPAQPIQSGRVLVRASLKRPNEEDVSLEYVLQQGSDGGWRIVAVMADGVNDLALRRAEYATIIREQGFDKLVQKIENKIADLGHAKVHAT